MSTAPAKLPLLAWHFLADDKRLRYGDRAEVRPGETLRVEGMLALCEWGLHASKRAIDALQYSPGPILCRVRLSGEILRDTDKACATERTVLWMVDATRTLHEFAIWCAREALERERAAGREPDARSWAALEAKAAWLDGRITDGQLTAARDAAWAAAWAAARAAAWAVARDAAWAATWAAAGDAAWVAAGAVARAAAGEKQNEELMRRFRALAPAGYEEREGAQS